MATVITVANQKGGVGKTVLCALTANALARDWGKKILVLDVDKQQNLFDVRQEDLLRVEEHRLPYPVYKVKLTDVSDYLATELQRWDLVLIDAPGRADDTSIVELLMLSDGILIPLVSDKNDRYGTLGFVDLLAEIQTLLQQEGQHLQVFGVVNQAEGRIEEKIMEDFCQSIGIPVFKSRISRRAIYARYNTYTSYISEGGWEVKPVQEEFKQYMEEFVASFKLQPHGSQV